jgi:O-antigen/teichoic acid export membrane protein
MNLSKHITQNKTFFNQILITLVIGVVVNFLNYLFSIYLARNLITNDFNIYSAILGIITLIQIPTIAIQTAITKKVASNKNFNLDEFKRKSTLQLILIALILSIIFLLLGKPIANISNIDTKYIPILSIVLFISLVTPVIKGFLLGLEKILSFNMILLFETVFKFVLGYIAISQNLGMNMIILSFCIPPIVTTIAVYPFIKTKSKEVISKEISLDYKQISLIFLTFLLLNVPFTLDLILVNPDVRASYGALSLIGKIVYFGSITIASLMISKLANSQKESRKKNLIISLIVSSLTGAVICLIYMIFTKEILQFVYNGAYLDIAKYIVPYSLSMIAYSTSYMIITSQLVNDSYSHIYLLLGISILQVVLYRLNNTTLNDVFINQVVIYGVLFVLVLFLLISNTHKSNGKSKEK